MSDVHTPEQRSRNMKAVKGKNTKPEVRVRSVLHNLGFRFRLHRKDLPGKPDIVLPRLKLTIFVNGCFWHSHECRKGRSKPLTRAGFWETKRRETVERDSRKAEALRALGWEVMVVWECDTQKGVELERLLMEKLGVVINALRLQKDGFARQT